MAAIFYTIPNDPNAVFRSGLTVNDSVHIPFLQSMINNEDLLIITEVTIQNRDTIQYFLTFDDLISFFYFGKGLGTMTINGSIMGTCGVGPNNASEFRGISTLMEEIGRNIRGKPQQILFGKHNFYVVLSSFTFRASAEEQSINAVDFNLQLEIIDHDLPKPQFTSDCTINTA